jgi:hypothetical protein
VSTTPADLPDSLFPPVSGMAQAFLAVIPEGAGPVNPAKLGLSVF